MSDATQLSPQVAGVARVGCLFGLANLVCHAWSMRGVSTTNYVVGCAVIGLVLGVGLVAPRTLLLRLLQRVAGPARSGPAAAAVGVVALGLTVLLFKSPQLGLLFWVGLGALPLFLALRRKPQAATAAPTPKRQLRQLQMALSLHLVIWTVVLALFALRTGMTILLQLAFVIFLAFGSGKEARRWCLASLNGASLLLAALAAFEFVFAPALAPQIAPTRYPYPYRMHGFAPQAEADSNRMSVTTDSIGLRTPSEVPPKPKGELRILVLGGSTMLGDGSTDDNTPSAFLERSLNAHLQEHPLEGVERVRVVNAGQGWYVTTQELVFLATQLMMFEPDLLLAVDGYNDAHHAYVWHTKPGINSITGWRYSPAQVTAEIYSRPSWTKAVETLVAASAVRELLGIQPYSLVPSIMSDLPVAVSHTKGLPHEEVRAMTQHRLLMNWTLMDSLIESCGGRAVFALQPVIYFKQPHTAYEQSFLQRSTTASYAPRMAEEWGRLEERIAAEKQTLGLTVFNAERYMRECSEELFTDYCHLTARGNELLAQAMHEAVLAELQQHWPWEAHYRGVRYTAEQGDPFWRAGPPMQSWVRGVPRDAEPK